MTGCAPLRLRYSLAVLLWGLLGGSALLAQSAKPEDLAVGKLLVVPRDSPDPNFAQSVVLLVRYGQDGAVGLMLNQPTKLAISRALSDLKGSAEHSDPVYVGGPVELDSVLALLASTSDLQDASRVLGDIFLVSTKKDLESALTAGSDPNHLRVYFGYCGWAPGQLENEVKNGDWYIFKGTEALVFDANPNTLWSRMISETEMHVQLQGLTLASASGR